MLAMSYHLTSLDLVPSLGLHSAAVSGDVGLLEYALNHGQPVNSVVDGVLPLHAACSGGNMQVVKLLIKHGADVNAPRCVHSFGDYFFDCHDQRFDTARLSRKYSSERGRDSSTPIIGTTGSTPLHFAAANGNIEVINLLLHHGAHADRADKHGVTPEMIALQNNWLECAAILRDWIENKDRDLRERESSSNVQKKSNTHWSPSPSRSRLHMKKSMDTAFAMLKSTEGWKLCPASPPPVASQKSSSGYVSPSPSPLTLPFDPNRRRPSLPQILHPSTPDSCNETKNSSTHPPRPRSAGTGDEQQEDSFHSTYGRGGAGRKSINKYSLINIFKKMSSGDGPEYSLPPSELPSSQDSPALGSVPIPGSAITLPLVLRSSSSSNSSNHNLHETSGLPATAPSRSNFFPRASEHSSRTGRSTPHMQMINPSTTSLKPSAQQALTRLHAFDLHHAPAEQQRTTNVSSPWNVSNHESYKTTSPNPQVHPLYIVKDRTGFASPAFPDIHTNREGESPSAFNDDSIDYQERKANPSPSSRPGILRAHNRTSLSGPGSPLSRTLRFDSSSSLGGDRRAKESPHGTPPVLRPTLSSSSVSKSRVLIKHDNPITTMQDLSIYGDKKPVENEEEVYEDENYGQVLSSEALKLNVPSVLLQRQRGLSFGSSSDAELSPIDSVDDSCIAGLKSDFPSSIIDGPVRQSAGRGLNDVPPSPQYLTVPIPPDNRDRGDSLSSNSTTSDYRSTSQTDSSSRGAVSTPGLSSILASPPLSDKFLDRMRDVDLSMSADEEFAAPALIFPSSQSTKWSHKPLEIDAHAISSYEEVEALVQQTRQGVLDLAGKQDVSFIGSGHTPLSAMLAAYGESLALERKLREQKESEEECRFPPVPKTAPAALSSQRSLPRQKSRERVQRQHSLREHGTMRPKRTRNDPRRPSTTEGGTYSSTFT